MFYKWQSGNLLLKLRVQPKASKDEFCAIMGDCFKVRITAPPVDGKANQHLIKFLAKQFKVSKSHSELISDETNREKRFIICQPQHIPTILNINNL